MTSQPGKQAIARLILSKISRIKVNQTMNVEQLIEYNMRNIFLKRSYTKYGEETIPEPFIKNQNWACLWIISLIKFVFIV